MLPADISQTDQEYVALPIVHLLKHPDFFQDLTIYLNVSEKYIRVNFADEPYLDVLTNVLRKGETQAFLAQSDFEVLILKFQQRMISTGTSDKDSPISRELKISENETAVFMAQTFIKNYGLNNQVMSMLEISNKNIQKIIFKSKNIASLLNSYRKNCSEEYFKISFTNFICSLVLNQFPWKTTQILDKLMLASTLCDLSLNIDDIHELNSCDGDLSKLSERVRNHPNVVLELLQGEDAALSLEVVTIIKQHHEKPDGSGFPMGIEHPRINQLSAIFIVSQRFAELVCAKDFPSLNFSDVALKIQEEYHGGFFTKTCQVLVGEVTKIK